jgi:hypothetical protein
MRDCGCSYVQILYPLSNAYIRNHGVHESVAVISPEPVLLSLFGGSGGAVVPPYYRITLRRTAKAKSAICNGPSIPSTVTKI